MLRGSVFSLGFCSCVMAMSVGVLAWNVRGLNNPARRNSVRLFLQNCNVSLVCLQESKLGLVDAAVVG